MKQTKPGLAWRHLAPLIATACGVGLLPGMPGTWASLVAIASGWIIRSAGGIAALAIAALLMFTLGWWATARVAHESGQHDPGFIVIDEIAAQWLVLLAAPLDWRWFAAAFLLFRVFDILKPWPIRMVDRRLAGGLGIMLDDVLAALYAVVILLIGREIFHV